MSDLPVGAHPQDARGPETGVIGGATPPSQATDVKRNFGTSNADALPVFERAARNVTTRTVQVSAQQSGTTQLVGKLKGRTGVLLWVPSAATNGVMLSENQGILQGGGGVQLYPGDSLSVPTEAALYIGLVSGDTTGYANVIELFNNWGAE